jgi:hypothetical protein
VASDAPTKEELADMLRECPARRTSVASDRVAALLQYAALMNGRCEKCGRILPHRDSDHEHICLPDERLSRPENERA